MRMDKKALLDFKSITLKLQSRETSFVDSHFILQTMIFEFHQFNFEKYIGLKK